MANIVDFINLMSILLPLSTIYIAMQSILSSSRRRTLRTALTHLLILSSIALLLSAIMAWANGGVGDDFVRRWARGFATSVVTLPLILAGLGALEYVVNRHLAQWHWVGRKVLVALLTALVLESVLALAVSLINTPDHATLGTQWWLAFSRSLPMGVCIGLFMGFYLKPRLDRMRAAVQ